MISYDNYPYKGLGGSPPPGFSSANPSCCPATAPPVVTAQRGECGRQSGRPAAWQHRGSGLEMGSCGYNNVINQLWLGMVYTNIYQLSMVIWMIWGMVYDIGTATLTQTGWTFFGVSARWGVHTSEPVGSFGFGLRQGSTGQIGA